MQLRIEGQPQTFIPIKIFRETWALPDEFQVNYFEPKNWDGLGSLQSGGEALAKMRRAMMAAIPEAVFPFNILTTVDNLTLSFQRQLEIANEHVGLRYHDIGFAVAGFEDVLRTAGYHLLRLNHTCQGNLAQIRQNFDSTTIYQGWLDASARLSTKVHTYQAGQNHFKIRIVNHIYGRVGLEVQVNGGTYYVLDKSLACPGENYMWELCQAVAKTLSERLQPNQSGP